MPTNRREFLQLTAAATSAAALGAAVPGPLSAVLRGRVEPASRSLRILILGGTGFTGPHQVHYAVARGHAVTVFNRGRREAGLPASVQQLRGDRNEANGLDALRAEVARGVTWDVVIDNPTTLPFWVRDAGRVLSAATQHYIFISTISVYADTSVVGMDESTPLVEYPGEDPLGETMQTLMARVGQLYGPLKAASERESERAFPGRATIVRPGLIVGPGDLSGRFTYWPVRLERGGEVLAPGSGRDAVQIIDARDLAEWTIRVAEQRSIGTFNATGPAGELSMAEMLGGIRAALDGTKPTRLTWAPAEFLEEQQVRGWADLPVWVPPREDNAGFSRVSIRRALDAGLTFRPLAVTARDTLDWFHGLPSQPSYREMSAEQQARIPGVFTADRETAVLQAWHARAGV